MSEYHSFLAQFKNANPSAASLIEAVDQMYSACFESVDKRSIAKAISDAVRPEIEGKVFTDDYWDGKDIACSAIADRFPDADIQLNTTDDGFGYQSVDSLNGMPNYKKWRVDVTIDGVTLYGCLAAEAAGDSENPFGKYRLTFYIS